MESLCRLQKGKVMLSFSIPPALPSGNNTCLNWQRFQAKTALESVLSPDRVSWLSHWTMWPVFVFAFVLVCVVPRGVSPAFTDSSITGEAAGWQPTIRIEGFTEKENIHVFQQDQFSNEAKDISPTHCPIMVENPLDSTVNGQLSNLTCFCISSHPSQEPSTAHTEHNHLRFPGCPHQQTHT